MRFRKLGYPRLGNAGRDVGAPGHGRGQLGHAVDEEWRAILVQDRHLVVRRIELAGLRIQRRDRSQPEVVLVVVRRDPGRSELILRESVSALKERRVAEPVGRRRRPGVDVRNRVPRVVETRNRSGHHLGVADLKLALAAHAQLRRGLIVHPEGGLRRQTLDDRRRRLVVVAPAGDLGEVGLNRPDVENVLPEPVQPVRRDLAEDPAVLEAGRRGAALDALTLGQSGGRVVQGVDQVPVVVARLREVARALQLRRDAELHDVAAGRPWPVFVRVEEEQLVLPARLPDRTADRVPAVVLLADRRSGVTVPHVGPGLPVLPVPLVVAIDVVDAATKLVRAALADGRNLNTGRTAVFRLVVRREDLHFGDRLRVHLEQLPVAAGVHRQHAVHRVCVLAVAALAAGTDHAGGERREGRVVPLSVDERNVVVCGRFQDERTLAARRLNDWRFGLDLDGLGRAAHLNRQRADRDTGTCADEQARVLQRLEGRHLDLDGVGVGRDAGKHEIARFVGHGGRNLRALRVADECHSRSGNDASLGVLHGTEHRSRVDLRRRRPRERAEQHRECKGRETLPDPGHDDLLLYLAVRRLTSGIRGTSRSGRLVSHRIEIPRIPALDTTMRPFGFGLRAVWKADRENTSTRAAVFSSFSDRSERRSRRRRLSSEERRAVSC